VAVASALVKTASVVSKDVLSGNWTTRGLDNSWMSPVVVVVLS